MIGHGGPTESRGHFAFLPYRAHFWVLRLVLMIALALCVRGAIAEEHSMRVRIAWGGGARALWQGVVALSEGSLSEPRALGIEADEPGSMWLERRPLSVDSAGQQGESAPAGAERDHLVMRQRSPRTYDGVDLLVTAPPDADLLIALSASGRLETTDWITIPLAELVSGSHNADLDDGGNRLSVRRAPGDMLRIRLKHKSLVFAPGETLCFDLLPHLLPVAPDAKVRIRIELAEGRGSGGRVVAQHSVTAGEGLPIEQEIRVPDEEGVYDLVLTATHVPLVRWSQLLATRRIQFLVLSPGRPVVPAAAAAADGAENEWTLVEEIDPANPKWWARFAERFAKLPGLSPLWNGPLGNGKSRPWKHPLGRLVQLGPSGDSDDAAWEAYTLPIDRPGWPHLLEFEFPSDVPQTLGVSILEQNAAGAVFPIGLDSGVELAEQVAGGSDVAWRTHRLIFWPKTKSPMVLITNRRDQSPAAYGKIRVLAGGEHLARGYPVGSPQPERLLAAYLDRPLFPENFSATQARIASSDLGVDDWVTFHQGATRLIEYLNRVGFNGLMISVVADGSTIYPSAIFDPTPRYDTGVFLEEGQDPVRKDVLEMLFRLFDREGLQLIPAMEFASPIPRLEAELSRDGEQSEGMRWIGKDGKTWLQTYRPVRGMAPYYNVLDRRVQETMLAAVGEVLERYGHHRSFAGLAIHLSSHGYAQLPGPAWGMDDRTIARFEKETGVQVPGRGPERFARRAEFLAPPNPGDASHAAAWLRWRADRLHGFYRSIYALLATARPEARLYLAGAGMLSGEELRKELMPALPQRSTITGAMLRVGIDVRYYDQSGAIVLLRPERIAPQASLARRALDLEIRQMPDVDRAFEGLPVPGSLFFHRPQELRLPSFDEKSPFEPTYTWLITQPVPSGWQNRRRFVHSLAALDAQAMFDGGWQLPMGQEDSLRNVVAAYRRLPAVRFHRLVDQYGSDVAQPVTIRYATSGDATYVYLVNDAPFGTILRMEVNAPSDCRPQELTGLRQVAPLQHYAKNVYWTVQLEPYDLVAVRFPAPGVEILRPEALWSEQVQTELQARVADLQDRAAAVRHPYPPRLDVLENPGFDRPPGSDGEIPGWTTIIQPGASVELDGEVKKAGARAVKMTSRGPVVARLISEPFDPPTTGRLAMAVWLRGTPGARQPRVRYVLQGRLRGEQFFRWKTREVGPEWSLLVVPLDDLPLEGLTELQVGFDLTTPGEVWIDEVQLSALVFTDLEKTALMRLIAPADPMLDRRQVRDCMHLLEGYWPRFLAANVPAPAPVAHRSEPTPSPHKDAEASPGILDRMRSLVPRKLRFF